MRPEDVLSKVVEALKRNEPVALITLIGKEGSGPRDMGALMAVFSDGKKLGTVGGGDLEAKLILEALAALNEGRPRRVRLALRREQVPEGTIPTTHMCGGVVEFFINVLRPPPRIIIIGAGHVGKPLGDIANVMRHRVVVIDRDPQLANSLRYPYAENLIVSEDLVKALGDLELTGGDIVVIAFGEAETDYQLLKSLITRGFPGHIWVLCSKYRANWMLQRLKEEGADITSFANRIHMPAGLAINSDTPEEIAISIWSEIICVFKGCEKPVKPLGII